MTHGKTPFARLLKTLESIFWKPLPREDAKGFSLVELLVALTLFGFLVSGIVTFVTAGLEVTEKTESQLEIHQDGRHQGSLLENALIYPVERIDSWLASLATTSGAVVAINGTTMFIGTQSLTGTCTGGLDQQFLVTHLADGLVSGETRKVGNYEVAADGLSVYSGSIRIIGSGVRWGNNGSPLETELGGISSIAGSWGLLALADPSNERLLFWNDTTGTLSVVTTRTTGIVAPTSVIFTGNGLLIGAKNGLYRMSDSTADGTVLPKTETDWPSSDLWTIEKVTVAFDGISNMTAPNSISDFTMEKRVAWVWQPLNESSDSIMASGSGFAYSFSGTARNLWAGEAVRIGVTNISPAPVGPGQYTAHVDLYVTGGTLSWSKQIPYFIRWDADISTLAGNAIEKLSSATLVRKVTDASTFESGPVSLDSYLAAPGKKLVSALPIRDFRIRELSDSLILTFEEYSTYDCREGNHRSQQRTFILRKKK